MKRPLTAVLLMLVALLCACGYWEEECVYQLYFTVSDASSYGSALSTEEWIGESETPTAQELMEALLAGPTLEGLTSPFPGGVKVQSLELDEEEKLLRLTLSDQYGGLGDNICQTLADACIVMTLCQLPGVEAVEIRTDGFWASRPASRTLTPEQLDFHSLLP